MILLQIDSSTTAHLSYSTILLSILGSGAFAALITFLTTNRTKNLDYKIDYRRYILKKRQDTYEDLGNLLIRLGTKKRKLSTDTPIHNLFLESMSESNPVHDFMEHLTSTLNKNIFWITADLHDKLIELLQLLSPYHKMKSENNTITSKQIELFGLQNFNEIERIRLTIFEQYFEDLKELDNIKKFKNSKKKF